MFWAAAVTTRSNWYAPSKRKRTRCVTLSIESSCDSTGLPAESSTRIWLSPFGQLRFDFDDFSARPRQRIENHDWDAGVSDIGMRCDLVQRTRDRVIADTAHVFGIAFGRTDNSLQPEPGLRVRAPP